MSVEMTIKDYAAGHIDQSELAARLAALGVSPGVIQTMTEVLNHAGLDTVGPPSDLATAPRALTAAERAAVEAISGRIIPTTDTPGAIEAGSADYIDFALAGAYTQHLPLYQSGLKALDHHCNARYGTPFAALHPSNQDSILHDMEQDLIAGFADASAFFELVRNHVMEGLFCEPYYGGNRDMIGWKLVGFPGTRYGYDESYVGKHIDLPPVASGNHPPRKEP